MDENNNQAGRTAVRSLSGGTAGGCLGVLLGFFIGAMIGSMVLGQHAPTVKTGTPFDLLFGLIDLLVSGVFLIFVAVGVGVGGLIGTLFGSAAGAVAGSAAAESASTDELSIPNEKEADQAPPMAEPEIAYVAKPVAAPPVPAPIPEPTPTRWLGMCPCCQSRCAMSTEYVRGESVKCPQCDQQVVMDFVAHVR